MRRSPLPILKLTLTIAFTAAAPAAQAQHGPPLSQEEFEAGKKIYFERCSGCHGATRKGATGPALTPQAIRGKPGWMTMQTMMYGTANGMPAWGASGILTHQEISIMNRFIRHDPPTPPAWGESEVRASWRVLVPPDDRPRARESTFDADNVFAVTLRDAGAVAIIDGDTKTIVTVVETGFAVHISRFSASGRYLYTIGRDGRVTLIDLWMREPQAVAEIRIGLEARSVEASRHPGFEDRFLVAGAYWPSQFLILDGQTLEPLHFSGTGSPGTPGDDQTEARVAGIVASHIHPEFLLNIKEPGKVLVVNYASPDFAVKEIAAAPFLHDGGFDISKRYFMSVANSSDKVAVIDTRDHRLTALVDTHNLPHPGRGANFFDPEFGPVWATGHLGATAIDLIGTDPEHHPQNAWRVVRSIPTPDSGSLFIKTHPNSQHLWVDFPLSNNGAASQGIAVYEIGNLSRPGQYLDIAVLAGLGDGPRRVVQAEYDKHGREVWLSVWNAQNQESAIVVMDDATATVSHVIKDPRLVTPTGKFNSYNTRHGIY